MTARARRGPAAPASSSRLPLAAGALAGAAVVAFVAWYVLAERWIYFWDQSGYWLKSLAVAERLPHDPLGALATVLGTIRRDDYNQLIVVPLAPAVALFGEGRLVYVLSVAVLYGLAAAASVALFAQRAFLRPLRIPAAGVALGVVTVVLAPRLWLPVLVGLPDVAGCIVIPMVWWALRDPVARIAPRRLAGIAAALVLLVVLRRWYAYWVVALLLALAIEQIFRVRDRRALLAAWVRIALLAGAVLLLFLLVTGSHGIAMLTADYGRMHAAYRSTRPLLETPPLLLRDFGAFWLLLAAAGAVVALRAAATRAAARLLLVQSLLVVLLFARTQSFNAHHLYLLFPQLATFAAVATATLGGARRSGRAVAAVVVALLVTDFAVQLAPGLQRALGPLASAFGRVVHPPLVRSDLGEVARLARTLDGADPRRPHPHLRSVELRAAQRGGARQRPIAPIRRCPTCAAASFRRATSTSATGSPGRWPRPASWCCPIRPGSTCDPRTSASSGCRPTRSAAATASVVRSSRVPRPSCSRTVAPSRSTPDAATRAPARSPNCSARSPRRSDASPPCIQSTPKKPSRVAKNTLGLPHSNGDETGAVSPRTPSIRCPSICNVRATERPGTQSLVSRPKI